jgi:hypothetical protein
MLQLASHQDRRQPCPCIPGGLLLLIATPAALRPSLRIHRLQGNSSRCLPCPAGHFCVVMQAPEPCASGYFADGAAKNCSVCPPGYFAEGRGNSLCTICPAGSFCPETCENQPSTPLPCRAGSFSHPGQEECDSCSAGSYSGANATHCLSCPPGHFCPPGSANPIPCPGGWMSVGAAGSCSPCLPGTYSACNATACTLCPPGAFCGNTSAEPSLCPSGSFAPGL